MMGTETLRVVVLFAPGDRLGVDVDADIAAGEAASTEIIVAQPVRPAPAAGTDVEDARSRARQPLGEHEKPEVARMCEEVDLVVEDAVADANARAQMIGRQIAELRIEQPRHDVEGVDRQPEQRIEGQQRGRGEQSAQRAIEAQALERRGTGRIGGTVGHAIGTRRKMPVCARFN